VDTTVDTTVITTMVTFTVHLVRVVQVQAQVVPVVTLMITFMAIMDSVAHSLPQPVSFPVPVAVQVSSVQVSFLVPAPTAFLALPELLLAQHTVTVLPAHTVTATVLAARMHLDHTVTVLAARMHLDHITDPVTEPATTLLALATMDLDTELDTMVPSAFQASELLHQQ